MDIVNSFGAGSMTAQEHLEPIVCMKRPTICDRETRIMPRFGHFKPFVGNCGRNSGFTLIELMVTVVVAGILLTLAVPSMRTFIQNARIANQTNEFIADLNFARTEAIKRGANVTLCKSNNPTAAAPSCTDAGTDWAIGRIIFIDTPVITPPAVVAAFNGTYEAGETLLRVREPLEGGNTLIVNDTSGGGANAQDRIVYTRGGGTTIGAADTATFNLCDERGAIKGRAMAIGFRGKLTVSKPPASCN